ncbi:hypothetical protein [Fredinandcohnia quinoae]|uniref:Uncharacterized protein n=1 Tax=Fredinandcohnia quinoae TaxID=2918902 RepID=A0AAW5E7W1_9BACI|nr:hypothetical protein [Fredinandcohnia sp. SECRCQ15]MCH1625481.1 hypothetical protein [Fredinandcohnia sp. SECRCQ15]
MKIESATRLINKMVIEKNYSRARALILQEWKRLIEVRNYHLLNDNAKQLVKIIKEEKESGAFDSLTTTELKILYIVNQNIRDLQLSVAKRIYSEHPSLFERAEAKKLLTADARFICESWNKSNMVSN